MKTRLIAVIAIVVMSFGSIALAGEAKGPVMLTDTQMDNVVAAGPAWGHDKERTTLIEVVPGEYDQATYNYVGDVYSARPNYTRSNYRSYNSNAIFH